MISGYRAAEITAAASAIFSAGATGCMGFCTGRGDLPCTSILATFSGRSMKLTPGFSACASLKALRTTSGMVSGSITCVRYFEIGRNRFTRSRC